MPVPIFEIPLVGVSIVRVSGQLISHMNVELCIIYRKTRMIAVVSITGMH